MDTDLLKKLVPFFADEKPIYYKKGQVIIRPEDKIDHIYFIEKGYVRFYHLNEDGRELTFLIYKPGYVFPVAYTFLGQNTRYYFESMTPVILKRSTRGKFNDIILSNVNLMSLVNQEIVKRLGEALERMEVASYGNANKTISYVLKRSAEEFGIRKGNEVAFPLHLTHQIIASLTGLARETVSIEMKKLQDKGLINYKGNTLEIKSLKNFVEKTGLVKDHWQ